MIQPYQLARRAGSGRRPARSRWSRVAKGSPRGARRARHERARYAENADLKGAATARAEGGSRKRARKGSR